MIGLSSRGSDRIQNSTCKQANRRFRDFATSSMSRIQGQIGIGMAKFDSYVICTSPRSGSTLLCKMLTSTGAAGKPDSYFFGTSLEEWLDDLGIVPEETADEREILKAAFRAAYVKGRNGTGVFGLRMQRHSFEFFCEKLAILHPGRLIDRERFRQAFGSTLFLHLTRPDKIGQAVSYRAAPHLI